MEYIIRHRGYHESLAKCDECFEFFEIQTDLDDPKYYEDDELMKIKTITYRRTHNRGNFNSESLEMSAELDEYDDPFEAAYDLQNTVLIALGLKQPEPLAEPETINDTGEKSQDLDEQPF